MQNRTDTRDDGFHESRGCSHEATQATTAEEQPIKEPDELQAALKRLSQAVESLLPLLPLSKRRPLTFVLARVINGATSANRDELPYGDLDRLAQAVTDQSETGQLVMAVIEKIRFLLVGQELWLEQTAFEDVPILSSVPAVSHFEDIDESIDFIAECIETNAAIALCAQFAYSLKPTTDQARYAMYFAQWVFPKLCECHQKLDLRTRYQDRKFPTKGGRYTLGGHAKELGHIHIDFVKSEQGWALDNIWECR